MKITVLNGSPKGDYSITLQTVRFIEKHNSQHTFTYLNVGQSIKAYEKDFSKAEAALMDANLMESGVGYVSSKYSVVCEP